MPSAIQKYLLTPRVPNIAAGFIDDSFTVVDLRRNRNGFALASSAVTPLPAGLVSPAFDSTNIHSPADVKAIILQTAEAAGLAGKKRWSAALPEGAARTLIITLESRPEGRRELNEVLAWKIERVIAVPASELRISRQRLNPAGNQERYLVTVAQEEVVTEYEALFESVGWQVGLLLPRHMGEAQWLAWDRMPGDKMLVSSSRDGFTSVVTRNGELMLVRTYTCDPESRIDELHRFALYYRDRLSDSAGNPPDLSGLLVLGRMDRREAQNAVKDALDRAPHLIDPAEFGFDLADEPIAFDHLAGAAGLASLCWQ
ncbi:MAG TPA: hypothetical protein VLD57_09985 [Blastocatellia bacterium]|nr:hypothetical protein [Blastocatellia bacterium]